jgi:hypothetical protein
LQGWDGVEVGAGGWVSGEVRGEVWVFAIRRKVVQAGGGVSECSGEVVNFVYCRVELLLQEGGAVLGRAKSGRLNTG